MADPTVLLGEFAHETNTFAPTRTDREAFRERREYIGEEIGRRLRGTNTTVGGILDVADREDVDLLQTVAASATPGGVVTAGAYDHYTGEILDGLRAADVDGVALSLHGAMVPEGGDDGEGPLLSRVREAVGPGVPLVATLDLHANVTREMCEAADALVAYETYPHVDMADTGRRAMELLVQLLGEGPSAGELTTCIERPPLLAYPPQQNTGEAPMAELTALARDLEDRPGVRTTSVLPGFGKADVPEAGFSVLAVGEDAGAARDAARELARATWERRESFVADYPRAEAAVHEALVDAGGDGPVVLADTGDNPGGGGAGDGTTILRELLDQGARNAGLAIVHDPEAVGACLAAGVGERVALALGGKTDDRHGAPVDVDGYVKALTDGVYENTGPMGTGTENDLGRAVLLQCGAEDGVSVVVSENRLQPLDAEIWRHVGMPPERFDVLAVKSTNHYRADYEPLSSRVQPVDTPGLTAVDPARFDYENVRRPVFPLDELGDDDYPDW